MCSEMNRIEKALILMEAATILGAIAVVVWLS